MKDDGERSDVRVVQEFDLLGSPVKENENLNEGFQSQPPQDAKHEHSDLYEMNLLNTLETDPEKVSSQELERQDTFENFHEELRHLDSPRIPCRRGR